MSTPIRPGDMVRLLNPTRPYSYGYVIEINTDDEPYLTLDTAPGGITYLGPDDVERVDMPQVEPDQIWESAKTGVKVRTVAPDEMLNKPGSKLVWKTDTLTPGRWVGTVILTTPAWRLVTS